jgi:hypothetical protein
MVNMLNSKVGSFLLTYLDSRITHIKLIFANLEAYFSKLVLELTLSKADLWHASRLTLTDFYMSSILLFFYYRLVFACE